MRGMKSSCPTFPEYALTHRAPASFMRKYREEHGLSIEYRSAIQKFESETSTIRHSLTAHETQTSTISRTSLSAIHTKPPGGALSDVRK